eukprot:CAMPEP_0177613370 /NCGR_PEP_ID=MMETSP0419_2-20121207/21914_1 /TAXON_ID=582737 /ORGANISM="Tetraselmis sp., Strain GSL018" /LENGTH=297 /DNA_ID=CAMNT_0019110013 /DNA_START=791 /DNA_END=1684 /DNA_ORIENTATION=-
MQELQPCPQVARLFGCYEDFDNGYIVMEALQGGSLFELVSSRPVDEMLLSRACKAIVEFLAACHDSDILYGDVKPTNFMFSAGTDSLRAEMLLSRACKAIVEFLAACHDSDILYGDVKPTNFMFSAGTDSLRAIDFGCSQRQPKSDRYFSTRSGTPAYFAPEVFRKCYTLEADMWSLGMSMYQIITGHLPWWGDVTHVTPAEVMEKVLYQKIPYYESEWRGYSPELLDLVQNLLVHNPANRLKAAEALHHPAISLSSPSKKSSWRRQPSHVNEADRLAAEFLGAFPEDQEDSLWLPA